MELIRHVDLRLAIGVKLTVAPKRASTEQLLDAIMSTLSGAVIVKPDMVGLGMRHGEFGVTEPHPFPDLRYPGEKPPTCPKIGDPI